MRVKSHCRIESIEVANAARSRINIQEKALSPTSRGKPITRRVKSAPAGFGRKMKKEVRDHEGPMEKNVFVR